MLIVTESNQESQEFFSCSCHSEGILVTDFNDDDDFDIYLAMYSYGLLKRKRSIKDRIRYAWKHLTTGKIWEDEVIMTPEAALKLGNYLIQRSKYQTTKKQKIKE